MRPPDSSEPFLVDGISYRNMLQVHLVLEMAMTLMAVVPALLMSEMNLCIVVTYKLSVCLFDLLSSRHSPAHAPGPLCSYYKEEAS
jgi:hypothetical protein